MMKKLAAFIVAGMLIAAPASAQTTYTYEYDQFGRLVRVERNTGDSSRVRYTYDGVDNRTRVKQGVSAPTATNDWVFVESTFGVTLSGLGDLFANDTDADLPFDSFSFTAVGGTHGSLATIQSGNQTIYFGAGPGSYSITYTMKDSSNMTSTAQVSIEIIPPITCPPECW
ncbi:MAG: hypothetical protein RIR33_3125 [Pseudomonadota bacterium]